MPVGTNATVKALSPGRHQRRRAPRSSSPTRTTSTCGRATSGSRGSAACIGSWTGIGPILTDSGGFQVVSLGDLRVVDEDGVTFRCHLDGSIHRFTPGARDRGPGGARLGRRGRLRPAGLPELAARRRGRRDRADASLGGALAGGAHAPRTRRCSASSRAAWTRSCAPPRRGSSRRCRSTASASAGWPATRPRHSATRRSTSRCPLLADDPRPRYLMGLGSPADLLEAVHRGVDLFDCVLPARVARNGQLWVPGGRLNLRNRALPRRSAPGPGRLPVPRSAAGSRGPIWPTCSGPRSCSRTGSRLVTT